MGNLALMKAKPKPLSSEQGQMQWIAGHTSPIYELSIMNIQWILSLLLHLVCSAALYKTKKISSDTSRLQLEMVESFDIFSVEIQENYSEIISTAEIQESYGFRFLSEITIVEFFNRFREK